MTDDSQNQPPRRIADVRQIAKDLNEARAKLTDALKIVETRFVQNSLLSGRVTLRQNQNGVIEHLVFKNDRLLYECGKPGRIKVTPLLEADMEVRMLAAHKIVNLWEQCGGSPIKKK